MIFIKDQTDIGITQLINMIGIADNYIETIDIDYEKGYDKDVCTKTNCKAATSIQKGTGILTSEQLEKIKVEFCCKNCIYKDEKFKKYINEKNDLKIKQELKFTKTQIWQFLLYHSVCDSLGLVKYISEQEIKERLLIDIRTIRDNNKFFIDNGLIGVSPVPGTKYFGLFITNYKSYFKTKKEYGRGYLRIDSIILEKLFNINNINQLRIALRELIQNSRVNSYLDSEIKEVTLPYTKLKSFLPSYMSSPAKIKKVIHELIHDSNFDVFYYKPAIDGVIFQIKNQYKGTSIKFKNIFRYRNDILNHISRKSREIFKINLLEITDLENSIDDFVQMSQQYNLKIVLDAIDKLLIHIKRTNYCKNYGGFIREKIEEMIEYSIKYSVAN